MVFGEFLIKEKNVDWDFVGTIQASIFLFDFLF